MLSAGFLGAHHYYSLSNGRPSVVGYYEVPNMSVFNEETRAASQADLAHLDLFQELRGATETEMSARAEEMAAAGNTAGVYELRAIHRPSRDGDAVKDLDVSLALMAPSMTTFGFSNSDESRVASWFADTFTSNGRKQNHAYIDVRLMHLHHEQDPITPLRTDGREWLVMMQWPNRSVAGSSLDPIRHTLTDLGHKTNTTLVSDLLTLRASLLNDTGWLR